MNREPPVAKTGIAKIFEQGLPEINSVAKKGPLTGILGQLYADQISNQLGIKVTPPGKSDRTENEEKEFITEEL